MPRKSKKGDAADQETKPLVVDEIDVANDVPKLEKRTRKKAKAPEDPVVEEAPSSGKGKRLRKSPKIESDVAGTGTSEIAKSDLEEETKSGAVSTSQKGKKSRVKKEADGASEAGGQKRMLQKVDVNGDADKSASLKRADSGSEKVVIEKSNIERYVPVGRAFKLITWNVTTLRSLVNKNSALLKRLFDAEKPDLVCLQETKLNVGDQEEYETKLKALLPGHSFHWNFCTLPDSKSYSGTLAIVRGGAESGAESAGGQKTMDSFLKSDKGTGKEAASPESVKIEKIIGVTLGLPTLTEADGQTAKEVMSEGRTITVEYDAFFVVATYVPNSGDKLQRLEFRTKVWDRRMGEYLLELEKRKPVVWCGDLNVAHLDADIWNAGAKHLAKSAGTTPAERQSFSDLLGLGFVDAFRHLNPAAAGWFSYWSVRAGNLPFNRGLRLDYCVTSQALCPKDGEAHGAAVKEVAILTDFVALDHAAVALTLAL
jgi:exodeoxyribonuclease III